MNHLISGIFEKNISKILMNVVQSAIKRTQIRYDIMCCSSRTVEAYNKLYIT
jgi:hypothetical protein